MYSSLSNLNLMEVKMHNGHIYSPELELPLRNFK